MQQVFRRYKILEGVVAFKNINWADVDSDTRLKDVLTIKFISCVSKAVQVDPTQIFTKLEEHKNNKNDYVKVSFRVSEPV